ncbi:MAG: DUF3459 domain-containing protein, partial [Terracidiphilus sp.]
LTGPFVPMLFQGEEWAVTSPFLYFANHEDPAIAGAVSQGRKHEFAAFGWDPDSIPDPESLDTFTRSKLHWDEVNESEHAAMRAWYRDLMRLRRSTPDLNDGEPGHTNVAFDEQQQWLRMARGSIVVFCNLGPEPHAFALAASSELLLASEPAISVRGSAITLPADSTAILRFDYGSPPNCAF